MANSQHVNVTMEEQDPLYTMPGSGDMQNNGTCCRPNSMIFSHDNYHRKLAICSVICGISCIGIKALIHSVKAEHTTEPKKVAKFSQLARKYAITSIVVWVLIVASILPLMALVSYLLTLAD